MSKFNPATWLNRSRVFSESSIDVSANESLDGLNYVLSQNNLEISDHSLDFSPTPTTKSVVKMMEPRPSSKHDFRRGRTCAEMRQHLKSSKVKNIRKSISPRKLRHHSRHQSMPVVANSDESDFIGNYSSHHQNIDHYHASSQKRVGNTGFIVDDSISDPSHRHIQGSESFGDAASCISGLSMDDTHVDDGGDTKFTSQAQQHYNGRIHPLLHMPPSDQAPVKGRDFGHAFDHLIHDRDDRERNEPKTSASARKRHLHSNVLRPIHSRTQSDSMALRPTHNTNFSKNRILPAHATLREMISSNGIPRPPIMQTRSTSNTVSSTSSGNLGNAEFVKIGVWNGQPLDNLKTDNGVLHVPSTGSGSFGPLATDQSDEGTSSSHNRRSSSNELLGTRPRRCFHSPSAPRTYPPIEDCDQSLQDVPEDDPSTKWNDGKSMESRSVLSGASTITSGQRKRVVKDEIKFIMSRFVPARLRSKSKNKEVNLERSEGCLT